MTDTTLSAAAEQALEHLHDAPFSSEVVAAIAVLESALAEQPPPAAPEPEAPFDGTAWARQFAAFDPPAAPEPSEAELPPLPIGEAEVVWHEPDPVMPERPGKIIDASMAFFDAAPLGTHLYTAEQMREYALRAAAAARNTNPA